MAHAVLIENDGGMIDIDMPAPLPPVVFVPMPPDLLGPLEEVALEIAIKTKTRKFNVFRATQDRQFATYIEG